MFTLIEIENSAKKGVYRFLCDTIADLQSLPNIEKKVRPYGKATAGTMAFVVSENQTYILSPSNKWIKISTGSSSGSSGGVVDLSELYTTDENGNKKIKPSLLWSNIYVGSGEAPDWADIQIDPNGEVDENSALKLDITLNEDDSKVSSMSMTGAEIKDAIISNKKINVYITDANGISKFYPDASFEEFDPDNVSILRLRFATVKRVVSGKVVLDSVIRVSQIAIRIADSKTSYNTYFTPIIKTDEKISGDYLTVATADRAGVIKIGDGLDIAEDGTLSLSVATDDEVAEVMQEVFG